MDLPSLLAWRNTCVLNYAHATAALKRSLTAAINPFLSHPNAFLDIISRYSAVIGGEVALAFVRRHHSFQPQTLEIFASVSLYEPLCHELLSDLRIAPDVISTASTTALYPYNQQRDILDTTQIGLRSTRTIYIRQSSTLSPLSPIARSICTAMANFVTPHSFGCAYPCLTLHDKSLLSDLTHGTIVEFESGVLRALADQQIEQAIDPASWRQYQIWSPALTVTNATKACWRSHYICPGQSRFFGDRGSLVDFIDPLGTPSAALLQQGSPPFGTTVIWRLSAAYRCPLSCESRDNRLPMGQLSTAIILMPDPFTRPRLGRPRIPMHNDGANHYAHPSHRRRKRSTSL